MMNEPVSHRLVDGRVIGGADHTSRVLNHKSRNKIVVQAVCDLRKIENTFDSIIVTGISGLLVGPDVASILNKHLVVIRKSTEECYSPFIIEGVIPHNYIILDDLICSGKTVNGILKTMKDECPRSRCSGVYSYLKEHCAYRSNPKLCRRDLGVDYL